MNAGLFAYEDVHQTRLAPHANVGVGYVIDISKWLPWVGFTTGVVDIVTLRCSDVGTVCGHHIRPALGLAGGLEYRVPAAERLELPLGIRFEYQFLLPDEPWSALFFTAYAAVVP